MSQSDATKLGDRQDELEKQFAKLGLKFLRSLYATLKTAALYEANNKRYTGQASEFRQIVAEIFTEDNCLEFAYRDGYYFLNTYRMTLDTTDAEADEYLCGKFEALHIQGLSIFSSADAREIDKFIFCFSHFKPAEDPAETYRLLYERLKELQIENVMPVKIVQQEEPKERNETTKFKARKVFFLAIATVQDVINQANSGGRVSLARTKRVVQSMVDQIIDDETALTELTVLRKFDDYTYAHSVNVCIYSLILGHHMGLDKKRLSDLGLGALLHDLGKISLPESLIKKESAYNEMDWEQIRVHPVFGAKSIIRSRGIDRSSVRAISAAYEHHITYTGNGYPELLQKRPPCLFAQIVAIADSFDAMCSGRVYHKKKMTADEVVTNMANRSGADFNPLLLKVFVNSIGVYPIGSVVRLNTNELAIVSRTNPRELDKPQVKIIADRNGLKPEVRVIDLSSEQGSSIYIQSIIDADKYNINPADFIDLGE